MRGVGRDIAHWQVAFYGRPRGFVENLVFDPGFRHCIAFAFLDADRWLEVRPTFMRLEFRILTGPQYSRRLVALTRAGAHIVPAVPRGGSKRIPRIATCSGAIGHILGVGGALLPIGLYRALTRDQSRARAA